MTEVETVKDTYLGLRGIRARGRVGPAAASAPARGDRPLCRAGFPRCGSRTGSTRASRRSPRRLPVADGRSTACREAIEALVVREPWLTGSSSSTGATPQALLAGPLPAGARVASLAKRSSDAVVLERHLARYAGPTASATGSPPEHCLRQDGAFVHSAGCAGKSRSIALPRTSLTAPVLAQPRNLIVADRGSEPRSSTLRGLGDDPTARSRHGDRPRRGRRARAR